MPSKIKWAVILCFISLGLLALFLLPSGEEPNMVCWRDAGHAGAVVCRKACARGQFHLPGMKGCHSLLTCNDIEHDVQVERMLNEGVVKKVYLARWKGIHVVLSDLTNSLYKEDFLHNIAMHHKLDHIDYTVQMLGQCNTTVITEYFRLGNAAYFHKLLEKELFRYNNIRTKFQLCISYVSILVYLHNSPAGTRVMCDSNSLLKTLSQYLLHSDLSLRLNDLDALPEVTNDTKIKCGLRQLQGDFVAPEQLKNPATGPGYDEKSDIWKIPDVCLWFLGGDREIDVLKFHLSVIHKKCKEINPLLRPTAVEVLYEYTHIWQNWHTDL